MPYWFKIYLSEASVRVSLFFMGKRQSLDALASVPKVFTINNLKERSLIRPSMLYTATAKKL